MEAEDIIWLRADSWELRAKEWIRKNALKLAKKSFGQDFLAVSQSEKMSDRFIKSLKFNQNSNIGNNEISISFTVSSYKTDDDKPLWKFFEYGTKDHWIEPVNAKALHWTKKGGDVGRPQGIYFQSSATQEGDSLFSKGHYVRGIKAREVMGRTKKRGIQKFKNLLISGLQNYMDRTATKFGV